MTSSLLDRFIKTMKSTDKSKIVDLSVISKKSNSPQKHETRQVKTEIKSSNSNLPENYTLTETASAAFDALKSNVPVVFLTGRAGTGKTTFIHYIRNNINKNIVIVAPTEIAAINVGGQTIHSFFKFPPRAFNSTDIKVLRNTTLFENLDLLIIDEISMVRSDLMDHIDYALQKWRNKREPFGGVQLLLVGDCLQLPPVVTSKAEDEMFNSKYDGPWFFDAKVFKDLPVYAVELTDVFRQKDERFIQLLSRIRLNDNHRDAVGEINRRCYRDKNKDKEEVDLILTATNAQADVINTRNMDLIKSDKKLYHATFEGDFRIEGKRLPAPEILELKQGTQVIVVKNTGSAVNGTLGIVKELQENSVIIVEKGTDREITCGEESWEQVKYVWDFDKQKISGEIIGRYKQIPLALGWAVTIHKSQGLTLDSVCIDLGRGSFAPGQTYVALSRCRSIEKLSLAKPISMKDVMADPRILRFYESL